ncbi:MAG TPA: hypothetical protein VHX38_34445 [Pseudonocardiaceae bacterium]|nr:hypothetical protein [Pseudonocardiaceae bacterium]
MALTLGVWVAELMIDAREISNSARERPSRNRTSVGWLRQEG